MDLKVFVSKAKNLLIKHFSLVCLFIILITFYAVLYKIYIPRISAFGCFDDCFNYVGGYFTQHGMTIYKDFFFNHQPIPALISYVIQTITNPINIFELILRHRQFLLLFSFLFNILFLIRFRSIAIPFIFIFELSKFYVFGDRFLAEGMIVYPLIFMLGITFLKLSKQKIYAVDYLLSAVFAWFIIFSREPFIPLTIFLILIIFRGEFEKIKKSSILILLLLSSGMLLYIQDLKEFYFNVVTFNLEAIIPADIKAELWGPKIFHIFLYPLYIPFYGDLNIFRTLLLGIDVIFVCLVILLIKNKNIKILFLIILILGLANLRVIYPGTMFYGAFHLIVWWGFFIFTVSFLIFKFTHRNTRILLLSSLIALLSFFIFDKNYFAWEKVNSHEEYINNFGYTLGDGEIIKILSEQSDKLFLERSDDLIFWQSGLISDYKYGWYTSKMNFYDKYNIERINMFKNYPPEFYREYGTCPKKAVELSLTLPEFVKSKYTRLYSEEGATCIFVRNDKLKTITDEKFLKVNALFRIKKPLL